MVPVVNKILEFKSFTGFKHRVKWENVVPDGTDGICGKPNNLYIQYNVQQKLNTNVTRDAFNIVL